MGALAARHPIQKTNPAKTVKIVLRLASEPIMEHLLTKATNLQP
jgi:hypothetical protein